MMKRLLTGLLMCLFAVAGFAEVNIYLNEGFEAGIPATWTQQVLSTNAATWVAESSDLQYPSGAFEGDARAALRNETGTTQDYQVRLIAPELNLQHAFQPMLIFAHAQANRNGRVDTLRVLYRPDSTMQWFVAAEYTEAINSWQEDSIFLPMQSAHYQIAFQVNENLGRGVVLDNVRVHENPSCGGVINSLITPTSVGAIVRFGTMDLSIDAFVMAYELTENELESFDVASSLWHAEGLDDPFTDTITGLQPNTTYYLYYRTACTDAIGGYTEWEHTSFATSRALPYLEEFNLSAIPSEILLRSGALQDAYESGMPETPSTNATYNWKFSTSLTQTNSKHVYCYPYSSSYGPLWMIMPTVDLATVPTDSAVALSFKMMLTSSSTATSAVTTASYLAGTEFDVLISEDGGETWTENNTYKWTFENDGNNSLAPFNGHLKSVRLNLSKFIGKSIRVAFVCYSSVSGARYYHVDDINIDYCDPNCAGVSDIVVNADVHTATVSWTAAGTNAILLEMSANADYSSPIVQETLPAGSGSYNFTDLASASMYYVRIKQDCPDNEWTETAINTPAGLPYEYPFNSATIPDGWKRYGGSTTSAVHIADVLAGTAGLTTTISSGWTSTACGTMCGFDNNFALGMNIWSTYAYWLVTPSIKMNIEEGETARMSFRVLLSKASVSATVAPTAPVFSGTDTDDKFAVIVSEDDGLTWTRANATIWAADSTGDYLYNTLSQEAQRVFIELTPYAGKTIKVAFVGESMATGDDNYIRIGDIRMATYDATCAGVTDLKVQSDHQSISATWNTVGATTTCIAQISSDANFTDTLYEQTNVIGTVTFTGLDDDTQYYLRVRQTCDEAEWSNKAIATKCMPVSIPYTDGFEDDPSAGLPGCWIINRYKGGSYPQIVQNGTNTVHSHGGVKALTWGTASQAKTVAFPSIAALPALDTAVNKVELSFWLKKTTTTYTNPDSLYIGVMTDPLDESTFDTISGILPASTDYEQYFVSFYAYTGTGRYIAFRRAIRGQATSATATSFTPFTIDDVELNYNSSCVRMGDVKVRDITTAGATVEFDATNAQEYQIVITDREVDINAQSLDSIAAYIVYNQTVTTVSNVLNDTLIFTPNTLYYVYVRGLCSATEAGAWSRATGFRTLCAPMTPEVFGTESFDDEDLSCWHFGFMTDGPDYTSASSVAGRTAASATTYGNYLELSKKLVNTATAFYRDNAYAIMPELNVDSIKNYQVNFRAATTSSPTATAAANKANVARLSVGVVTDPTDLSTIEYIKTISLEYAANYDEERQYSVSFADYAGDYNGNFGRYVIFKSEAGADSTNFVLIDDVSVEEAGACAQLIEVTVTDPTTTTARMSWEASDAPYFEVRVSTVQSNNPDTLQAADFVYTNAAIDTNFVVITGLSATSQYYAYVRQLCGGSLGEGKWSSPVGFKTAIGVPYLETFDDMATGCPNSDWVAYRGNTLVGDSVNVNGMSVNTTTTGWNIQAISANVTGEEGRGARVEVYSAAYNTILVTPAISLPSVEEGNGLRTSFKVACVPYSSSTASLADATDHSFRVMISTDGGNTFTKVESWMSDGTGDYNYNDIKGTAVRGNVDLTPYQGRSVQLGFFTQGVTSTPDTYLWLDSVAVEEYNTACGGIKRLQLNGGRTLTATWEVVGAPQAAIVELSKDQEFETVLSHDSITGEFTKTWNNLDLSSIYYVRVRQACDAGEWTVVPFRTPLGIPYSETFAATTMPTDWSVWKGDLAEVMAGTAALTSATASSTSTWGILSATTYYGINGPHLAAEYYSSVGSTYDKKWAIGPDLDLSDVAAEDALQLTFDLAYTKYSTDALPDNTGNDQFFILGSTDSGNTWEIVSFWDDTVSTDSTYRGAMSSIPKDAQSYTVDMNRFVGNSSLRFAFYAQRRNTGGDNRIHIANVLLRAVSAGCVDPTDLVVDTTTASTAVISWQGDTNKPTVIEWSTDASLESRLQRDTLTQGLTYTMQNLKHSSKYYVRIHQLCGETETISLTTSFLTECATVTTFPWEENFDAYGAADLDIPCWRNEHIAGTAAKVFTTYTSAQSGNSTGKLCLPDQQTTEAIMLVLPEMTITADSAYAFSMDILRNNTSNTKVNEGVSIWISATDTLDSTAVKLAFLPRVMSVSNNIVNAETVAGWYHYEIVIPTSGTGHIIIRSESEFGTATYMDNLMVRKLPTCKDIKNISLENITSSSVDVRFNATNAANYEVLVATEDIDIYGNYEDSLVVFNSAAFTDTVCTATGLSPMTTYYVYVRGLCDGNDFGEWSKPVVFTSACLDIARLPWRENFDSYQAIKTSYSATNINGETGLKCWETLNANGSATPYIYVFTSTTASYIQSQPNALATYGSASVPAYLIMPAFAAPLNTLQIEFAHRETSTTTALQVDFGYMTNPLDANSFVSLKTLDKATTFSIEKMTLQDIPDSVASTARLAFKTTNYAGYWTLDDVVVSLMPTCRDINHLNVNPGTTDATVVFDATNADNYEVIVSTASVNPDSVTAATAEVVYHQMVTTDTVVIPALTHSTDYHVYVRGVCSDEDKSVWSHATFTTLTLASVPYYENFDVSTDRKTFYSTYQIPKAWNEYQTSTSYYANIWDDNEKSTATSTYYYSGSAPACMRFYASASGGEYVTLPEMDKPLDSLQLSFRMRCMYAYVTNSTGAFNVTNYQTSTYGRTVSVGTMDDPNDPSTFQLIKTITLDAVESADKPADMAGMENLWKTQKVNLYGATGKYIALVANATSGTDYVFIDDVVVDYAPDCQQPAQIKVLAADTFATVTWLGRSDNYEYVLGPVGLNIATVPDSLIHSVNSDTLVLSDLASGTSYCIFVRSACDSDLVSEWSEPKVFTTAYRAPYREAFDSYATASYPTQEWKGYRGTSVVDEDGVFYPELNSVNSSSIYGWYFYAPDATAKNMHGTAMRAEVYAASYNAVLTSPALMMPALTTGEGLMLSFRAQACAYAGGVAPKTATTHAFHVMVSTDGGDSFTKYQSWTCDSENEFQYNDLTDGILAEIDMSEFAGMPIQIAFFTEGGATSTPDTYFYLDSVVLDKYDASCTKVKKLKAANIMPTSVQISWLQETNYAGNYIIQLDTVSTFAAPVATDTVNGALINYNILQPATTYYVRAQKDCGSEWVSVSFKTPCLVEVPASWNFDNNDRYLFASYTSGSTGYDYYMADCFTAIGGYYTSVGYGASVADNGTYIVSTSGSSSLQFYNYKTTTAGYENADTSYVVLPLLDVESMDNIQMRFKMRPTRVSASTGNISNYTTASYAHRIIVGTVTDPTDMSTFVPVDTCTSAILPGAVAATSDPNGQEFWETFTVDFSAADAKYIAFLSGALTSTSTYNYEWIDDISVYEFNPDCQGVNNLAVSDVSKSGATVSFNYVGGVRNARVALSTLPTLDLDRLVQLDTLTNDSVINYLTLNPSTKYYVFIQQLCGEDGESPWESTTFRTNYGLPFVPEVGTSGVPEDWTRMSGLYTPGGFTWSSTTSGWNSVAGDEFIPDSHFRVDVYGTGVKYWLLSPTLDLSDVTGGVVLNFSAYLTAYSATYLGREAEGVDDKLIVFYSLNDGDSWWRVATWNNDGTGEYVYNDLINSLHEYHLNLSNTAGSNTVKFAFYAESTVANADNYLHVGNVSLKACETTYYDATVCFGDDYDGSLEDPQVPFYIEYGDYSVGLNTFDDYTPARQPGDEDHFSVLRLTVDTAKTTTYDVTVCEGETYIDENFNIPNISYQTNPEQTRILTSRNGCDSTIVMYLTILPRVTKDTLISTCEGNLPLAWNGRDLTEGGTYVDTLVAANGCDSIVTLMLIVTNSRYTTEEMVLCYGDTLYMADQVITEAGEYMEMYTAYDGCDSIDTWIVTAMPELRTTFAVTICQGDSYNDDVFVGVSANGLYEGTAHSVDGCDSTVTLILTVYDEYNPHRYISYAVADLPLIIDGEEVLAVGTAEGEYTHVAHVDCGDVTYHITLGNRTGLDILGADNEPAAVKRIENNQLVIYKNGKKYNALGTELNQ